MLFTYARRELGRRPKQTVVVAVGLAIAVALLMVVNSLSAGVSKAQSQVLSAMYGVGTDITVTQRPQNVASANPSFGFGRDAGTSDAQGNTSLSGTVVRAARGQETFDGSALNTITAVSGVSNATAILSLEQTTFNGQVNAPGSGQSGQSGTQPTARPTAGQGGQRFGGGQFNLASLSITGVSPGATLGPLATLTLSSGRMLTPSDDGQPVALVSSTYASNNNIALNSTVKVGTTDVTVVGTVASSASTISDIFLPLSTAQTLANLSGQVNEIFVQAANSSQVDSVASAISTALPTATLSTDKTLAQTVTGSLASASSLVGSLGKWLSLGVLAVAFVLAVLFTVSGVNQRTRDFGTLKAIGWSNRRVVAQVALESMFRALVGAVAGIGIGLITILVLNKMGITLSGSTGGFAARGTGAPAVQSTAGGAGGAIRGPGDVVGRATTSVNVVLQNPVSLEIILIGLAAALVGGVLAGIIGGWRAARMRPAAALRSVE